MSDAATILIVDDEPYNVDYLQQELADQGYRTREAYGGREALDAVSESAPDLILLDVMMPDIDGITVCRMLKSDPATRLIPIVIMTALDSKEDRIRGIEAGADDFLTKPVDDRELLARINAALAIKQAVDETVGELASAADQLTGMGSWSEDSAVVAVDLRPDASPTAGSPDHAFEYLKSRYRNAVHAVLERFGAQLVETDGDHDLAVFRASGGGPEPAIAAEAALAVLADVEAMNRTNEVATFHAAIAVHMGPLSMKPRRVAEGGATRWTLGMSGVASDEALRLLDDSTGGEVLASAAVVDGLRGRYRTEPAGSAYRLLSLAPESEQTSVDATPTGDPVRMMATILVSDLVGSTEIATKLGDRAWTNALEGHYRLVRSVFDQFDGEEINTSGDGFLALFDRPAVAIQAALDVCAQSDAQGLPVRVGIHTGELERTSDNVQGINVHLAARVSAEAGSGQVLVSSTTRDAAAGSGLRFEDRGEYVMKGIDEPRRLYLVVPD